MTRAREISKLFSPGVTDINVGIVTATSFIGDVTGDVTGDATGLSGTPDINVGIVTGTKLHVGSGVTITGAGEVQASSLTISGQSVSYLGVGIATESGTVGTGATLLDFRGAGISTVTVSSGIATINVTGGGGGGGSLEVRQSGSSVGTAITAIDFISGATLTANAGISTITIYAGIITEASSGGAVTLDLSSAQDHKVTATGITTITVTGGTEGESHTVRIINSGSATVGFSTYFLFPSGSSPTLPTADGAISLISFTVNRVGAAGTQLLAGASLNFS